MNLWLALLLPLLGGIIGWVTNWLAVKMIFRPRTPRKILGFTIEGLLPRRRNQLAASVAETVEKDLLSVDRIQELVRKMVKGEKVKKLLHERVETLLTEQIKKFGPLASSFLSGDLLKTIQGRMETEILSFMETMAGEIQAGLASELDIQEMVRTKIEGFDLDRLEQIIQRIANQELKHIVILGGFLGFLVGLVEVGILWLF